MLNNSTNRSEQEESHNRFYLKSTIFNLVGLVSSETSAFFGANLNIND